MVVTLYPGAQRTDVLDTLRRLASEAQDADNTHGGAYTRLTAYLDWANNSVRMLEHRLSAADIDRLVLTRGYERLLAAAGSLTSPDTGTHRVLNGLLSLEIRQRINALDQAVADLGAQITRWSGMLAFVLPDTSVYLEHEDKLEQLDFHSLLQARPDKTVRVVVPVVVLAELDGSAERYAVSGTNPPSRREDCPDGHRQHDQAHAGSSRESDVSLRKHGHRERRFVHRAPGTRRSAASR